MAARGTKAPRPRVAARETAATGPRVARRLVKLWPRVARLMMTLPRVARPRRKLQESGGCKWSRQRPSWAQTQVLVVAHHLGERQGVLQERR